jgi:GGDEF domain-containing protein
VNDPRGHAEGDRVLARVAEDLRSALRAADLAARLGADPYFTSTLAPADAPNVAGRYSISARAAGCTKLPGVVAFVRKKKSYVPFGSSSK